MLPVFAVVAIRQSIRVASEQAKPTTEALPYPEVSIAPEATPEATATPESSATPVTPTPAEPGVWESKNTHGIFERPEAKESLRDGLYTKTVST